MNKKVVLGVGAGLAAAGVAAYLLTGKKGAKNRAKLKQWSNKIQKEVTAEIKKLKSVSKEDYLRMISNAIDKYEQMAATEAPAKKKSAKRSTKK